MAAYCRMDGLKFKDTCGLTFWTLGSALGPTLSVTSMGQFYLFYVCTVLTLQAHGVLREQTESDGTHPRPVGGSTPWRLRVQLGGGHRAGQLAACDGSYGRRHRHRQASPAAVHDLVQPDPTQPKRRVFLFCSLPHDVFVVPVCVRVDTTRLWYMSVAREALVNSALHPSGVAESSTSFNWLG